MLKVSLSAGVLCYCPSRERAVNSSRCVFERGSRCVSVAQVLIEARGMFGGLLSVTQVQMITGFSEEQTLVCH